MLLKLHPERESFARGLCEWTSSTAWVGFTAQSSVADALSRRAVQSLSVMITKQAPLLEHKRRLELEVVSPEVSARLMSMVVQLSLMDMI